MTFSWLLVILFTLLLLGGIIIFYATRLEGLPIFMLAFGIVGIVFSSIAAIWQPIELNIEQIRQTKERKQIEMQISSLDETKDKVKLNEWLLTYNDWINDINTSKEVYGWFSWHRDFDMTGHEIIELK